MPSVEQINSNAQTSFQNDTLSADKHSKHNFMLTSANDMATFNGHAKFTPEKSAETTRLLLC